MTATLTKPRVAAALDHELVIDNFAGGGGASLGIRNALGREVDYAINHDEAAVIMHRENHPGTVHLCESVWKVDPREVVGNGRVGLAWFSPDCTHHSRAKGGKPRNNRMRGLAWVMVKWGKLPRAQRPRLMMLENVSEFEDWGPLDAAGWPIARKRGLTFRRFVGCLRALEYRVEWRVLNAADYGTPTERRRLFMVARCDKHPIRWPEPTHGDPTHGLYVRSDLFNEMRRLEPHRGAFDCIDWKVPLDGQVRSPRIAAYIERINEFWRSRDPDSEGRHWILSYYGNPGWRGVFDPLPTITTRDRFALVNTDGRMRMLTPRELARCQGFPDDYVLTGTKTNQVARIGNSVCPPVVEAMVRANMGERA